MECPNQIVKSWLSRCNRDGVCFAIVTTVHVVYDRVAVKSFGGMIMVVEYPKKIKTKAKTLYKIVSEVISVGNLVDVRYYKG